MQLSRVESAEVIDAIAPCEQVVLGWLRTIWAVFDRTMVVYWSRRLNDELSETRGITLLPAPAIREKKT